VPRDGDDASFFARGQGGQIVYVDPALDLVTVVTGDPRTSRGNPYDLVPYAIAPAAAD
jgi:CubicO group peptidase (beta-lactamase class C family)